VGFGILFPLLALDVPDFDKQSDRGLPCSRFKLDLAKFIGAADSVGLISDRIRWRPVGLGALSPVGQWAVGDNCAGGCGQGGGFCVAKIQ